MPLRLSTAPRRLRSNLRCKTSSWARSNAWPTSTWPTEPEKLRRNRPARYEGGSPMPTLLPQMLSGLVVIPTVEDTGGVWAVSLGIDVGMSRTPPPQVVNREDLVVELRNPAEGSFEPIASPDPGPLPVRAIRVEQARADYTFAHGVNQPTQLVVNLLGAQRSFPMSQTYSPTACLGREPKPGGPVP